MKHFIRGTGRLALLASLSFFVGCGDDPKVDPNALTYYKDVKGLVDKRCITCHVEGGIAPFVLTNYRDVYDVRLALQDAVLERKMPPWQAGPGCTEYEHDISLTDDEVKVLADWVDQGAIEGDPADAPAPVEQQRRNLSRVDLTIGLPVEYTPVKKPDDYRCFVIDWPETTDKFVTGFDVRPGDSRIVHHVIAFIAQPNEVDDYRALDDAEEGPGYTCFGGPGLNNGGFGWLGGWAPGGLGDSYPEGTGIRMKPGSAVILQVHYNAVGSQEIADQTEVDLRLEDNVDREATILPFANPFWITQGTMKIPAGEKDVEHSFQVDIGLFTSSSLLVYSAQLHQHELGTSSKVSIVRQGGEEDCMLDIPRWDFNWQDRYVFKQPKKISPGDKIRLECHWDNSAENQPIVDGQRQAPKDVFWGDGTSEEMCLGIFYVVEAP